MLITGLSGGRGSHIELLRRSCTHIRASIHADGASPAWWLIMGWCSASHCLGALFYISTDTGSTNPCKQHVRLELFTASVFSGYFVQDGSFKVEGNF